MANKYNRQKLARNIMFMAAIVGFIVIFVIIIAVSLYQPRAQREDFRNIADAKFDTVFLAMYPISTYDEETYRIYRGMELWKATYCIPDLAVMKQYLKHISASGNTVSTVYLGIRPDKVKFHALEKLCMSYPDIGFEIILSYPSADYWRELSEREYEKVIGAYRELLSAASSISNASFYFVASQKWLLANPDNYWDEWTVNEEVAQSISLQCDIAQQYFVTAENKEYFAQQLQNVTQEIRSTAPDHRDLSDYSVVFFGDSVIGNYTDSTSIPGVVAGLTGAKVYNCGYGGNSAAMAQDAKIALAGIAEAFVQKELSILPPDTQVYRGIAAYLSDAPEEKRLCVVINYGLNDYFMGYPISSEDSYDITTYSGAVRSAVTTIRTAYPDVQIILCTPSYCEDFQFGTEPHGDADHVLTDYVETILTLAEELKTSVLDTYHGFYVNRDNWTEYLEGEVHPNEAYRYLIGEELSRLIR